MLHNDRSGNALFCSLMLQARVYSKCNPYGCHKSMEVYCFQVQCGEARQASEKSELQTIGTIQQETQDLNCYEFAEHILEAWLAPSEGKLRAGRKDESNFVSSIRIGV